MLLFERALQKFGSAFQRGPAGRRHPTRFHFSVHNHVEPFKETLFDMFRWLDAGLIENGHAVTFSDSALDPRAVNLVWEGFTPDAARQLSECGHRYGLIVTEFMDGGGFNKGTPQSGQFDRRDAAYRARWECFCVAASRASFFWTMVESNVEPLQRLFGKPAAFVELGFSDRLVPKTLPDPDIDFSFTGIMTPFRRQVLEQMEARAKVVWSDRLLPIGKRDRLIYSTKINLSINKTSDWEMPSPTRVGLALLARRGVALDRTPQVTRQSQIVGCRPADVSYTDFALDQLSSDWRQMAEYNFERFRATMPMREIASKLLDETVAL